MQVREFALACLLIEVTQSEKFSGPAFRFAGFIPGKAIEDQGPVDMVEMRNVVPTGEGESTRGNTGDGAREYAATKYTKEGDAWASLWTGPQHVYFGHDAKRRFQQHPFATGLDTGCCYGGELTGIVLPGGWTRFSAHDVS